MRGDEEFGRSMKKGKRRQERQDAGRETRTRR